MKTKTLSVLSKLTLLLLLVALTSECSFKKCSCAPEITKLVSNTYALSILMFGDDEGMTKIVRENALYFKEDGEAIKCLKQLPETYISKAIESYSPGEYDYTHWHKRLACADKQNELKRTNDLILMI